jgi:hypothetical protein
VKNGARPTGTPIAAALAQAPEGLVLDLTEEVPCPGPRFGKQEVLRSTLLSMHGDMSFTVKDRNLVYIVAKRLGVVITTRQERGKVRVWRIS